MKIFVHIKNLDDLKKEYRRLAKQFHPDAGGSTEAMQNLNALYGKAVKELKQYGATDRFGYAFHAQEAPKTPPPPPVEEYLSEEEEALARKLAEAVIVAKSCNPQDVELCGAWVWVTFAGKPSADVRETLKAAGFRWAPKKEKWYFAGVESRGRGQSSMDDIREKYGSANL